MQKDGILSGTSSESFEEAARNAMGIQVRNFEQFEIVSTSVTRGGLAGRIQYDVLMRRVPVVALVQGEAN